MSTQFDHRYFTRKILRAAEGRKWSDVITYAESAETLHGGGTAVILAACTALVANNAASPEQRTATGAASAALLTHQPDAHAFLLHAWSTSPCLRSIRTPDADHASAVLNDTLPSVQTFFNAVHADDSHAAHDEFSTYVEQEARAAAAAHPGGKPFVVYEQGEAGLSVALRNFAYMGCLMSAATTALRNTPTT